ncbi:amino acid ABC transporter permease [Nocardioides sp. R-C-SC26]|uniref:amino acid ABC transporter permease n=1 Tax=Nocardioides sp. R-C-SC26 TaxID=2870414 RepID=UPI001E32C737|nr:amino acid ABC transporter permease [Nocardioides sp. R-C-SC26]
MSDWTPSARELERRRVRAAQRRRSLGVSSAAVVVFFGIAIAALVSSPGFAAVRESFFDLDFAGDSVGGIASHFWVNVKLFLICEVLILVVGLTVALTRASRAPVLAPLRILAVVYVDVLRGIPTVLLVLLLGFGVPALQLQGLTSDRTVWAGVALVLSYGAYVAEVFRAGIDSVHPSQIASAQALGLSQGETMRFVVVPQAVRRVIPPLLNDFISLQKDTALVSVLGIFDAVFYAQDYANYHFNYTPYVVVAAFFIALTIPTARFTDWLQARMRAREQAAAR